MDRVGNFMAWENYEQTALLENLQRLYDALLENIDLQEARVKQNREKVMIYVAKGGIKEGSMMWAFRKPKREYGCPSLLLPSKGR